MKGKISKRTVDALKPGDTLTDSEVRGFRARCLPSASVVFEFRYRAPNGQRKFVSLGVHGSITAEEARTLSKKYSGIVADDRDPVAERSIARSIAANTVDSVIDNYLKRDVEARGLRSVKNIKSAFDRLVRPRLGSKSIYDLKRTDMSELLDHIEDTRGAVMADRTLAYLRAAFNWHAARDDDFRSPIVKRMMKTKPGERKRDRILDDAEIRDVWAALDLLTPSVYVPACYPAFMRALLLTGQRRSNVSMAHADEIASGQWIIPASRMKGKKDHLVPITPALKKLFGNGKGFLFSSDGGKTPFSGFSKAKDALDQQIAELRKGDRRKPMPHWVMHDLRRTARSVMSRYTTPDVAERVLGHVIAGVRAAYDLHDYADEKRGALEKLAIHVEGVVHPKPDVVVTFPKEKPASGAQAADLRSNVSR